MSVVFAAAAMYREQVPSYKHLDERLDEGRFVFECILAGNLQAFTTCRLSSYCTVHLFGLAFFLEIPFLVTK